MEEKTNYMENNDQIPHMKSLALCLNRMVLDGYEDDFKVLEDGKLTSLKTEKKYEPEQVNVVNFFRYEGQSDPNDNTIMYVIETADGLKGTLVDAYGAYADERVSTFFKQVESIHKKTNKEGHEVKHH
ncbi:hypothetical protein [Aridibaculum aurantiacum]|uniref:hypothetical protein n=1 Tax=Aridibaculum aurantiacum TaxID=2810307 RepID=UPI001A957FA6|nr:hypothetical protein [Aridibaculum aurantiacum]